MATPSPSIRQYRGRTVDHICFDDMMPGRDTQLTQALVKPGQSGALVTGIQKLMQRFTTELLLEKGTLRYLPNRGTLFMIDARLGFWRTPADVNASFYGSLLDLETNLVGEELVTDPPDEKYGSAELLSVAIPAPDYANIRVLLNSVAGISREIIYPLRVNSIGLN
jgi:hypothetical protein